MKGAHEGQGLGLRFLKHVERTRFLVHILSVEDVGEDDPWAGFNLINEELRRFDEELGERQQIEVVNKIDLISPERLEELKSRAKADGRNIFFISARNRIDVEPLVEELWRMRDETAGHAPILHFADTDGDEKRTSLKLVILYPRVAVCGAYMTAPTEDWRQERARVLAQARVVVVKVGSAVLTDITQGLSMPVLENLAGQLAPAQSAASG